MASGHWWTKRFLASTVLVATLAVVPVVGVTTASAWSGSSNTGTLPGTRDYINSNTWMSTDTGWCCPWGNTFNWQSSTNLYGPSPWNAYYISDSQQMTTNGLSVSISNTGGGVQPAANTVIYTLQRWNTWNASQVGYNEQWNAAVFWNVTSNDGSNVRPYSWSPSYYNHAYATKWW